MESTSMKTKILVCILAIIIIVGIIITFTIGLNFELKYQETDRIQLLVGKEFEISDIKQITDEIFPNQEVIIQKARELEDVVSITAKEITDEQVNELKTKINEKFGTEITDTENELINIPHTKARDIIKPYVLPFIIASVIILVYMAIRYNKLGIAKTVLTSIFWIVITQVILLSIIAITRIPIGRLTIPMVLIVYIITLLVLTNYFEKEKKEKTEKDS